MKTTADLVPGILALVQEVPTNTTVDDELLGPSNLFRRLAALLLTGLIHHFLHQPEFSRYEFAIGHFFLNIPFFVLTF
jgi:hypothetical protein